MVALRNTLNAVSARIVGGDPIVRGSDFDGDVAVLVRAVVGEVERLVPI
jgi:hypothetical protein